MQNNQEQQKNLAVELAKQQGKQKAKQVAKKVLVKAASKLAALLSSKFGLALLFIGLIIFLLCVSILLLIPDMTKATKFENNEQKQEEVKKQLLTYTSLAMKYNIQDPRWTMMFDMALYENETLLEYSPYETAFMLFTMNYIEYTPTLLACTELVETEDEDGNIVTIETEITKVHNDANEVPGNCTITQEKKIYVEETLETKETILGFMGEKDAVKVIGEHPKRIFEVNDANLYTPFNPTIPYIKVEISYFGKDIQVAMKQAEFTKEQKDHVEMLLEIPEAIDTVFEEYGVTISGNYIGSGAYCVQDGAVDIEKIKNVLMGAGVFAGHEETFKKVAEKYNIDVVLMVSIALHETGNGTSNAVVSKNNPGGLMNPATGSKELFVFNSLDEGIEAMGRTLNNRINRDGLTTIEKLGEVYAPVGANNDPNNLNQYWVGNVGKNVTLLGGLTMNCSAYTGSNIVFEGDVSELRKLIASVGTRWIGNSTYVFGGGRSQSDINRGWFDCSSFVHWAYKQAGIDLGNLGSTSTETLNKMGKPISMSEIQVGDLIFWNTYKKDGHVAIYIGNGQFIGAQSSTGVAIVDVNNSYWRNVFSGHVRRLID